MAGSHPLPSPHGQFQRELRSGNLPITGQTPLPTVPASSPTDVAGLFFDLPRLDPVYPHGIDTSQQKSIAGWWVVDISWQTPLQPVPTSPPTDTLRTTHYAPQIETFRQGLDDYPIKPTTLSFNAAFLELAQIQVCKLWQTGESQTKESIQLVAGQQQLRQLFRAEAMQGGNAGIAIESDENRQVFVE